MTEKNTAKGLLTENFRVIGHGLPWFAMFWGLVWAGIEAGWIDVPAQADQVAQTASQFNSRLNLLEGARRGDTARGAAIQSQLNDLDKKLGVVGKDVEGQATAIQRLGRAIERDQQTIIDLLMQRRDPREQ